jgi:RND family efflux transporter MFP subunit
MKTKLITILTLIFFLVGCTPEEVVEVVEKIYPVEVEILQKKEMTEIVKYVGILQPEKFVNKTFENISEVEKIYVEEGDSIKVGDLLAKQNTDELENQKETLALEIKQAEADEEAAYQNMLAKKYEYENEGASSDENIANLKSERDSAKADMDAAEVAKDNADSEYNTAEAEYQTAVTQYNDAVALRDATDPGDPSYAAYQADVISKEATMNEKETTRDEKLAAQTSATTDYNTKQAEYEVALAQYNLAVEEGTTVEESVAEAEYRASEASYEAAKARTQASKSTYDSVDQSIQDSYIYSDIDGYVLQILAEEGEVSTPIMPAMVIGSSDTVATIGISQTNIRKVRQGMTTKVIIGDLIFEGEVLSISKIPDTSSRTYETNISFPEDLFSFYIGESAIVEIVVGQKNGIWIPINIIQNEGEDYVYIIKSGRVVKRVVTPTDIDNDYVRVEGLNEGEILVTNGMKGLKPGYLVNILNGDNDDE